MRVFVAGAAGAMGRPLVRLLRGHGHDVVGLTRRAGRRGLLEAMGARAVVADALDAAALSRTLREAEPTHVVHLLTALPAEGPLRSRDLRATNALRIVGTANLLRASVEAGARRLVGESFAGVYGTAGFESPRDEDAPLSVLPAKGGFQEAVLAMRSLEEQLAVARSGGRIETVSLRFGPIYGPEVASTLALARRLQRRQVFVPRAARGVASFVHVDDAATAILAALERPDPGPVYNVVDDEPTPVVEYLRLCAEAFGAPPPRTAPGWLLRLVAPLIAAAATTRLPLSNARARRELDWRPAYPTPREGLRQVAGALREVA
jgi:nucleoside-diphosphate-sugar epimerase